MRIVHVIDDARPVGGAQTYIRRLCAGTSELGWRHSLVTDIPPPAPLPGVDAIRRSTGSIDGDAQVVADLRPDAVLLHTVDSAEFATLLAGRVPTFVYEHDYRHISPGNLRFFQNSEQFCEKGFGARCFLKPYTERCNNRRPDRVFESFRRVQRWRSVFPMLAGVFCASDFVAGLVGDFAPAGTRVSVVGYPIDIPDSTVPPAMGRADVLYVGRTSPVKGIHHLLDAFALLAGDHSQSRLVLAAGPDLLSVRERAAALGISDRVETPGWLEGAALADVYSSARVLAVPSVWPEPFGMTGPEAMAYGVPVVASDVGGIRAWLAPGRGGTLVPAGDPKALASALATFLDDPSAADAVGSVGRAHVLADLTMERHLERLRPLLEERLG